METPEDRAERVERWRSFKAELPKPIGEEFLPEPGKIASKEQIAAFWGVVGHWNENEQQKFVNRLTLDGSKTPNSALIELQDKTGEIEDRAREETAKLLSDDQIIRGYEALGRTEDADRVARKLNFFTKTGQDDDAETFRKDEAKAMLEAGHNLERGVYDREQREMTEERKARFERLLASTFPEAANEVTRDTGHGM